MSKPKSICPGQLAVDYLVRHPGFDNRKQIGELFCVLRTKDGHRLPYGLALQQRLGDRIRAGVPVQTYYEKKNGCIRRAFYWITVADARRIAAARMKGAR